MTLFEVDPNLVKPGWTPLLILVILLVVMLLLYLSMRKQFRRIDVTQAQPELRTQAAAEPSGPAKSEPES